MDANKKQENMNSISTLTVVVSCFWLSPRSRKLIQESDQHLKDVEKILQNDKRYLVLECVPEERRKLIMFYIEDLDRRGPPPPPTASEPTRRSTKWPRTSSPRTVPDSSLPSLWPEHDLPQNPQDPTLQACSWPCSVIAGGHVASPMYHRDVRLRSLCYVACQPWNSLWWRQKQGTQI